MRQTPIPPVQPGEAIRASLMNQLVRGANTGRFIAGDGSVNITEVGGLMTFSAGEDTNNSDRDILVQILPPSNSLYTQAFYLNGQVQTIKGMYIGRMYLQPQLPMSATATGIVESPDPFADPTSFNCYVYNVLEFDKSTRIISQQRIAIGRQQGMFKGMPVIFVEIGMAFPLMTGGSITGHTAGGNGTVSWLYQAILLDGSTTNCYNALEPVSGTPGSLGVNISASNGTVNGGTCVVQPIGNTPSGGMQTFAYDPVNSRWTFSLPNSAQ